MSGTSLIGKTALITGAGSGIGKACVVEFARAGARVIAVDRDEIALVFIPCLGSGSMAISPRKLNMVA
ncbi:MAG: SDR family NAD(P)-dependent oxidoreductase [Actinobacteria bacterium]|uniref:SDR family NAD(P)-dependent oxidoreductase n=1 Tax=Candidatus Fonsibacter lacus TaxID=2576439 RepID=A0A965GFG1_9PROT|nr:SDR family NAD(P)-dependent oxidoreductase [Candidatus Fonsibacter lacus]